MVLTWQNIALCLSSTVPGFTRSVHKDSPSTLSPRARVIRSRYIYQLCQSPGHCYRPLKWREMFHLGMNRCGEIRVVGLKRRNGRKVSRQNFVPLKYPNQRSCASEPSPIHAYSRFGRTQTIDNDYSFWETDFTLRSQWITHRTYFVAKKKSIVRPRERKTNCTSPAD